MRPAGAPPVDLSVPCDEFPGGRNAGGYGVIRRGDRFVYAHRDAWEREVGPIPEGLEIDHLCENKGCREVRHLEQTTRSAHVRRHFGTLEECANGHRWDEGNEYVYPDGKRRECRACRREKERRLRERRRAA